MSSGTSRRVLIVVAMVALVGLATYWLASGRLMHWLLALHGKH